MGRSLELYFIDGTPDGMLTAEVFNWTGHVLMTPRTRLAAALARREARHSGVYLLLGEDDEGNALLYVGESECIADRIRTHDSKVDWWTALVMVTTTSDVLNKAHIRYLEARLVETAERVKRAQLQNRTRPGRPYLSEAASSNMDAFLDTLFLVLPAIRIDAFIKQTRPTGTSRDGDSIAGATVFELVSKAHNIRATAILTDGEMVVQAGSQARDAWHGKNTENSAAAKLHRELVRTGVLALKDGQMVFTESYAFRSPSAAGAVVNGRPTAGTVEWKLQSTGQPYKEWEAEQLGREE